MRAAPWPVLVVLVTVGVARVAGAEPTRRSSKVLALDAPHRRAGEHFERALAHYRKGEYRAAIGELNRAIEQDPKSKDLFYNLAIVHEKLGELDPAVANMQRYLALESDPVEMARARYAIDRMRGAEAEVARHQATEGAEMGRFDGWVLGTAGVAALGAVVGTIFGVGALVTAPDGDTTGNGTSIDDLRDRAQRAHTFALISDLAFAVSIASSAAAATLYFGRPRDLGTRLSAPSSAQAGLDLTLAVTF